MHRPQHVEALVEQQVRRWQLLRAASGALRPEPIEPWPIVTLSREAGSQGAELARRLAERLGFAFWDQELVHEVAERTGLADHLVSTLDEHVRGTIDEMIATYLVGLGATASEYVRHVGRIVHTLVHHGSAVVVGRGSQFLAPADRALRVRVVAPLEHRVRSYALRHAVPPEEARRRLLAVEADRHEFYRRYFDRDVGDPIAYDLVVNTATLAPDAAVEIVACAYRCKFSAPPDTARH
jgi:cytidylate kinase